MLTVSHGNPLVDCPKGPLVVHAQADAGVPLRLSLVIPTFNESRNICELLRQIADHLESELGDQYELIVVDDDSPDRTWEVAASMTPS